MGFNVKKVLVLYTGGTIGMVKNNNGVYSPIPNEFGNKVKTLDELNDEKLLNIIYKTKIPTDVFAIRDALKTGIILYSIIEYETLIDSSNMTAQHWIQIAKNIGDYYQSYDAFVVLQGTDTLAYTASALSFLLENLKKTVVVTGSQIPIFESRSDAKDNFISSLVFAARYNIPEVCVCFGNKLMRGNRTYKISSSQLNAFKSPNYPNLGEVGIDYKLFKEFVRQPTSSAPLIVHQNLESKILLQPFFPMLSTQILEAVLESDIKGVVLLSYGGGNIPSHGQYLNLLQKAVKKEVLIVNITQCMQGSVLPIYECGKNLENIGVISGYDMTAEAALTKLSFVLVQHHLSYEEKIKMMTTDLRGELSYN